MSKVKSYGKMVGEILLLTIWVGISIVASQFIVGWGMLIIFGGETLAQPVPLAFCSAFSYLVALWLILFVPTMIRQKQKAFSGKNNSGKKKKSDSLELTDRTEIGLKGLPTWTDIGLAPVGFLIYLLASSVLAALFNQFAWFDAGETQDVGFSFLIGGFDRVAAFIALVIMAPLAEEIIFRGWLYGKLRRETSKRISSVASITISALTVSLLFGVMHSQWNVGVSVFAMSLVLCGLREVTGTIYAGILLHMLKNGIAFYLLYILGIGM